MISKAASNAVVLVSRATLAVLIFDGFLCGVLSILFLPTYLGSVPFPVSALLAGAANVALLFAARKVAEEPVAVASPLIAWFVAVLLCMFGGPGGDVLLLADWRTAVLLLGGLVPPGVLLFSWRLQRLTAAPHAHPHPGAHSRSSSGSASR
ncbi:hypothetical protein CH289_15430 [Rhodococcus sp. RS1C4]|uniref:hypothetical protein n=1 Tax=Nocardiaceae TaxID=85025 RepID=UPI0003654FEB|nr:MULTISPECIES: hypothetical protein [Rhodococcus]OZC50421.1 hypothetical protein CH289_15430 [Rhodococcus sp. RS1C4]OZC57408.1 hypothetical protein CH267_09190 [Rhodococcus sp. 06-621-2]OZD14225.1 hypothetical protein CH253_23995 [Rhodococcus sp. 06-156-3C]OZD15916.1 hypothetical protein CH280_09810 [Rhodococcus sp. 06-156-4C]OZD24561.1 hypothetical protein CH247_28110 [Rhodococcus sp. 06-156-3b]